MCIRDRPKDGEAPREGCREGVRVDGLLCKRVAADDRNVAFAWAYLSGAERRAVARIEMHNTACALRRKCIERGGNEAPWQGETKVCQQPTVVCTQVARAVVQESNDAVTAAGIRTAGMGNSAIKAKDITRLGQPNLSIAGHQLATIEIAEQANKRQADVVFVAMYLCDRVGVDLQ